MRNRTLVIACGMATLAMTVMLIGAKPTAPASGEWEYAMYIESPGNFEWHTETDHVRATNATFFFERMGIPTGIEVSGRTGRIQPLLLNHLGRQGWELVEASLNSGWTAYWFKRPN